MSITATLPTLEDVSIAAYNKQMRGSTVDPVKVKDANDIIYRLAKFKVESY